MLDMQEFPACVLYTPFQKVKKTMLLITVDSSPVDIERDNGVGS